MLQEWIKKFIVNWAVKQFTIENLKKVLFNAVNWLQVKASETANPWDDWAVDYVASIINDDGKLKVLYDWLSQYVNVEEGICRCPCDYEELVKDIETCTCPEVNKTIPIERIVTLLQLILPALIEWWKNEKADN